MTSMQTEIRNEIQPSIPTQEGSIYKSLVKRSMDFSLSFLGILILSPVIFIVVLLVRMKLGSPVLFKQKRPGLNEEIFTMYKFRTMTDKRNDSGELLADSARLTKFGRFLRSTSLDEIPGLINIIKGDMSIVGPRPLLIRYLPFYTEDERLRHSVRPGLTGLSQVNGRNYTPWDERFKMDIDYVQSLSFTVDLKIISKTILKVLKRDGISADANDVMEDFDEYRGKSLIAKKVNDNE